MKQPSYRDVIVDALRDLWLGYQQCLRENFGVEINCPTTDDDYLKTPIGKSLEVIARAATNKLPRNQKNLLDVQQRVDMTMKCLFSAPTLGAPLTAPDEFWPTALGQLVLKATIWQRDDELITLSQAMKLRGGTLSAWSQKVSLRKIRSYPDLNERNPYKSKRVLKSDVLKMSPLKRRNLKR